MQPARLGLSDDAAVAAAMNLISTPCPSSPPATSAREGEPYTVDAPGTVVVRRDGSCEAYAGDDEIPGDAEVFASFPRRSISPRPGLSRTRHPPNCFGMQQLAGSWVLRSPCRR